MTRVIANVLAQPTCSSLVNQEFTMSNSIEAFGADESGATTIEYGFVAILVSIVGIAAWISLGNSLDTAYTFVSDAMMNAVDQPGSDELRVVTVDAVPNQTSEPSVR